MSSETGNPRTDDLLHAAKASMFVTAFQHLESIDVRALPMLDELFEGGEANAETVSESFLQAVLSNEHPDRLRTPAGPFVFIKASTDRYQPHFVPDMLGSGRVEVRSTALTYLVAGTEQDPWMSPGTIAAMREYSPSIKAVDVAEWVAPACRLRTILEGDFLLHLAGFRQLRRTAMQEARAASWSRILRPSMSSLLSIGEDRYDVVLRTDEAEQELAAFIAGVGSIAEIVIGYRKRWGHIPFKSPFDLGDVISKYVSIAGVPQEQVCRELDQLLADTRDQVTRYHLLQACVSHPDWVHEVRRAVWRDATVDLISLLLRTDNGQVGAEWDMRAALARYYTCYIDLHGPSLDPNRTLCLAWWAADKVVDNLIGEAGARPQAEQIREWMSQAIIPVVQVCGLQHVIAGPAGPPSLGRLITLYLNYPWSLALLGQWLQNLEQVPLGGLTPEQQLTMNKAAATYFALGYAASTTEQDPGMFQFQSFSLSVIQSWGQHVAEESTREVYEQGVSALGRLYEKTGLLAALKALPSGDPIDIALALNALQAMVAANRITLREIWESQGTMEWAQDVFRRPLSADQEILANTLVFLARAEGHECRFAVPHLFANLAATSHGSKHEFSFWLMNLVAACAATGSLGALTRLIGTEVARERRAEVDNLVRILDVVAQGAPAEVQGWLREIALCLEGR